jgi:hypothetical protein
MVLSLAAVYRSTVGRPASLPVHRVKARSTTLGSTRFGLIQVLCHLGFYRERIAARHRAELEMARALETERLVRIQEEQARVQRLEAAMAARWLEPEQPARLAEERRDALLLKKALAYESMSEEQQAAWRLENEIVAWLTATGEARA